MGVWRAVEEAAWLGEVTKDYGVISNVDGVAVSVVLAGKRYPQLFLKITWSGFLSKSVRFVALDRGAAEQLDAVIRDGLREIDSGRLVVR